MKHITSFLYAFTVLLFIQQPLYAVDSVSDDNSSYAQNLLHVFYPTDIRPKKMEKHIAEHCPEIKTTVFGKIKDFQDQTKRVQPDAILSYAPVIKKNTQYTSFVQGFRQGLPQEEYVLVSLDKKVDIEKLSAMKIGVLDILGRKPMKAFVSNRLGTEVKIARVTKVEDMLNLLTFELVDAIFVSRYRYQQFLLESKLPLVATELDLKMDLAVLAVKDPLSKEIFLDCFNRLGKQTNSLLGVDQWAIIDEQTNILGRWLWALK